MIPHAHSHHYAGNWLESTERFKRTQSVPQSDRSVSGQIMATRVTASAFGRCVFERECGDEESVRVGEAPEATIVVPSEIGAHSLLSTGRLHPGPFAGEIVGAHGSRAVEAFAEPIALQPGDRATLHLVDYPHVQVVLRREPSLAVNLRAPIGLRALFPVLTYGLTAAMLLAAIATSVVWVSDVQEIELGSDIARAMYNFDPDDEQLPWADAPGREAGAQIAFAADNGMERFGIGEMDAVEGERPSPEEVQVPVPSKELASVEGEVELLVDEEPQMPVPSKKLELAEEAQAPVPSKKLELLADEGAQVPVAVEKVAVEKVAVEKVAVEKVAVEKVAVEKVAVEKIAVEKVAVEKVAVEKVTVEKVAVDGSAAGRDDDVGSMEYGNLLGTIEPETTVACDDPKTVPKSQIDVVFVIDVSTTMASMIEEIERGLSEFDTLVRAQISGDLHYGLVVFVDDVRVTGLGQPYTDVAEIRKELAHWRGFTASSRQINSATKNTDWPENSLDALYAAATEYSWRPHADTLRLIVHATDDGFGDEPSLHSGIAVQHSYHNVVGRLQSERIRVASFAAQLGGECECLDVKPGLFERYKGQASIPEATAGAVFDLDAVTRGEVKFAEAVSATLTSNLCTTYPFLEFLE